ncbi:FAD-dependent monooxygenase [Streptomyces spectabilis]|uniref:Pyridine nucleotide-disulfide oxidoreductase n=1 Tax=Streptomyces spectabilis TaxID=68270 RepID=A0A516RJS3_STRST|nr:FAD-dependent monooxygenase [Streptomyces spectabilis]QDQ15918.1 pyridine nucleotide-disulfide oxidoreductase [Streptomyces spectabilis]
MTPSRTRSSYRRRRAVVIGAGLTGMLAAAALAEVADEVDVIERDTLPTGPRPRQGLPQAHHAHLLWSGAARAIEALLPGITDLWTAAGARRIPLPTGLVSMSAADWLPRWPEMQFVLARSRDRLDSVVRGRDLAHPVITVHEQADLLGLTGTARRVCGVRVRARDRTETTLDADLVVDASGRGSRAPRWLAALGVPAVREETVDSGLAYASRFFRAPAGSEQLPIVNVQSDPRRPVPGRTATIVPVEGARWLVTLSGTRGGQPTGSADAFADFARLLVRHPIVGDLIPRAEPLTDVRISHSTVNRRRFHEKLATLEGFLVLGDAVAPYNPLYGHGMSVAAQSAHALRDTLRAYGLATHGLARRVQKATAHRVGTAWDLAAGQDILYPGASGSATVERTGPHGG